MFAFRSHQVAKDDVREVFDLAVGGQEFAEGFPQVGGVLDSDDVALLEV